MPDHPLSSTSLHPIGRALTLLAAVAVLLPVPLLAQGWQFEPILRVGLETDDNAQLDFRTDEEIKLEGLLADLTAAVSYESRRDVFEFVPRLLVRNYKDEPDFDSDDLFFKGTYLHQLQNGDYGFDLFFDQQQVRNAERADTDLDAGDPGDFTDDDSGRVGVFGERTRWRFLPSFAHNLSTTSSIEAELAYYNVRYDEVFQGVLTDYDDLRLDVIYRHALSPTITGIALGAGRSYESKDDLDPTELDGVGAQFGVEYDLSDTTTARALIGMESTDVTNQDRANEVVGELVLQRRLKTIRLLASYQRLINASGVGLLSIRDSIKLTATRQLSDKMSAGLGLRAYQDTPLGASSALEEREYVQLRARFTWYMTTSFSAEFDYRYTVLNRSDLIGEGANSNQVNLWFSYHPFTEPR